MQNTKEILEKYKKIALVGASKDLTKTSSVVMRYLQEYGFKVYPVNPSMKGEKILGEKGIKQIVDTIPQKRLANVEEIAKTVIFLCSEHNTYITGQNIRVDGGVTRSV